MDTMQTSAAFIEELQGMVLSSRRLLARGGGSKNALSCPPDDITSLELGKLSGIVAYDPAEYTFTALAGTPLQQIQRELAANGQYLPFDPPLAGHGATLGGATAAGVNGPGRYRFGGMRDFILAVQFIDGSGRLVKGGGKVVKNAAGFDFPKVLIGSRGTLGVMVELTYKVFPRPEAFATLRQAYSSLADGLEVYWKFASAQLDVDSLDLEINSDQVVLWARVGGSSDIIERRAGLLQAFVGGGELTNGPAEASVWQAVREFDWCKPDWWLVKIALTPSRIADLELALASPTSHSPGLPFEHSLRRYSSGGQQAWLALPAGSERVTESLLTLNELLTKLNLSGLILRGPTAGLPLPNRNSGAQLYSGAQLGVVTGQEFYRRVKSALDPAGRFPEA